MKEFITAVAAKEDSDEGNEEGWVDFKVDGVVCKARRPSPGQVAYLTASMHRHAPIQQQISGAINFCIAIMDDDTAAYLSDKLLDGSDPFDIPQIQDIIEYLMEEWSGGRPTEQSSGSSQPEDTSGPSSTPSLQAVGTSSTSGSTDS